MPSDIGRTAGADGVPLATASRSGSWVSDQPTVTATGAEIPRHFLWTLDFIVLCAAFEIAFFIAPHLKRWMLQSSAPAQAWFAALSPEIGGEFRPMREVVWVLLVMGAATLLSMQGFGGYRPITQQSRTRIVLSTILSPLIGLSSVALVLFTLRSPSWSRLFIYSFTAVEALGLCSARLSLRWYRLRRIASGFYARNVVLIGPTRALEWMAAYFAETTSRSHYGVLGYLALAGQQPPSYKPKTGSEDFSRLGGVEELAAVLVHRPIHEVVAVQGFEATEWLRDVIDTCDYFRVTLRIVPEALLFGTLHDLRLIYHSDPLKLPEVVLRPPDLHSDAMFVKRVLDIIVSGGLLVLLSPLLLAIAIAIKLTSPWLPVFYRWNVVGYKGRRFTGYKFSTMVADADERREALMDRNQMQGPVFKIRDDPRATWLGRYLRKFSLNELPQLWSVLNGDMSLVGPRPAFPHELERYELWHKRKLSVRPGITCLWQVQGRNQISRFDDWVKLDLEYIDRWSLWLDLKILIRTVWTVIRGSGW